MSVEEAAKVMDDLTPPKPMTRQEKREQAERLKRFLALPPELQEGALRYAENIRASYKG